jgi:uncharacterized protein (TIGR02996 family)
MNLRTALEEAIVANPDDLAAHMAYADHLNESGDPRGEFIQTQLALEDPTCTGARRQELQQRERELLDAHQRDWLGPLAPVILDEIHTEWMRQHNFISRVSWRRGWLEEVYLFSANFEELRALKACPLARIVSRLDLHHVYYYEPGNREDVIVQPGDNVPPDQDFTALYILLDAPFVPHLNWLRIGEAVNFEEGDGMYNNRTSGLGLVELLRKTPKLEELHVLARQVDLTGLFQLNNLTRLRLLVVYHGTEEYPLEFLASNRTLPALERIRMHPANGSYDERSYLPRYQVVALCRTQNLPALKHLHIHGSDLGDEGCVDLVASDILRRLETLDLRFGCITDAGAHTLASCPDIRRLKYLSLGSNQLTEEGIALLQGLGIDVRVDGQEEVGSNTYLYTGDME